jgi:hypothetical protein
MSWRLYGERIETADMSGTPRVFQSVTFPKSKLIKAFRTWIIFYNTPVFTALTFKIYSSLSNAPGQLLYTSSKSYSPSDISTQAYGAVEIYFDFTNPIFLRKDTYQLALSASGYVGTASSHLAWVRGIPDPNNAIDVSVNTKNIGRLPFYLGVIDGIRN